MQPWDLEERGLLPIVSKDDGSQWVVHAIDPVRISMLLVLLISLGLLL